MPATSVPVTVNVCVPAVVSSGPLAVQVTKRLVTQANVLPPDELWALQTELMPSVFDSDDAKEGATAFIEKRDPVWTGH